MALDIYWTNFAKEELRNIFYYYKPQVGVIFSRKLIKGIVNSTKLLIKPAYLSQLEELLSE